MGKHPLYNKSGLIKNNKPQVMYTLVNKKAELSGEILDLKKTLCKLKTDLVIEKLFNDTNCPLNGGVLQLERTRTKRTSVEKIIGTIVKYPKTN